MRAAAAARALSSEDLVGEDDFWQRPRSSAEIRERLRDVLLDELGERAKQVRRAMAAIGIEWTGRSPAAVLFIVDELVAQARREERERDWGTR